jgi:hypothetical protein
MACARSAIERFEISRSQRQLTQHPFELEHRRHSILALLLEAGFEHPFELEDIICAARERPH